MTKVQYEGDIPTGWGSLSGQEESDRFWWGASMGVNVGHSETLLRPNVTTDDDQPLWWAKGGTLIGGSPARIKWMRSFWEGTSKREAGDGKYDGDVEGASVHLCGPVLPLFPSLGSLLPTAESFGSDAGPAANMVATPSFKDDDGDEEGDGEETRGYNPSGNVSPPFALLHFTREGTWTVPLPKKKKTGNIYRVHVIDYWRMTVNTTVLAADAAAVTCRAERNSGS